MKQNMKEAIGLSLKRYNDTYMKAANDRIDNIVSQAGTDNTEIVDARIDSAGVTHTTLNNRILAETKMNDQHLVSCSGEYITAENTVGGSITNLEVLGNTIQNEEDLADIKSVGELQEDGTYKMSILSCGKNLFDGEIELGGYYWNDGVKYTTTDRIRCKNQFISIKPNTKYVSNQSIAYVWYDNAKQFIKSDVSYTTNPIQSPKNAYYVNIVAHTTDLTINIALYESDLPVSVYEPYQENKCDILLPCQLEKVGDVSDRLYYDDVEKAWCIEKNITNVELKTLNKEFTGNIPNGTRVTVFSDKTLYKTTSISDVIININGLLYDRSTWDATMSHWFFEYNDGKIYVHFAMNTLDYNKLYGSDNHEKIFNKYNDLTTLKLILATPQKIVLPLSTQIALNSFFGTTHVYMESGEVEGTIKCKIPKSLGATVQSLNNKTDILSDRIEAIEGLKDSQNMKYETDKGYLVCKETKNGVIDDLKIEGKTLVNLYQPKHFYPHSGGWNTIILKVDLLKTNTKYYYKIFNLPSGFKHVITDENNVYLGDYTTSSFNTFTTINTITPTITLHINNQAMEELTLEQLQGLQILILEGDHTQTPPSYFEGLMSVGEDVDKIEVLSRKEDGNLFDGYSLFDKSTSTNVLFDGINLTVENTDSAGFKRVNTPQIKLSPNTSYKLRYKATEITGMQTTKCYVVIREGSQKQTTSGVLIGASVAGASGTGEKEISFTSPSSGLINITFFSSYENANATKNIFSEITLSKQSNLLTNYTPHQSDKKQILFYNENGELEPIQELHEWDSIEKHSDNKWYYHKRSGKVVLNGSENWVYSADSTRVNTSCFTLEINNCVHTKDAKTGIAICDKVNSGKFINVIEKRDIEGLSADYGKIFLCILKSKLPTQDVAGFKQWLQANNVTVVYQLAQEEVYELAPLHLDSYANETLILCNSGAISPKMEFSITSHINELVKAYGERVNLLEEKVYQYMIAQNRMQLASTYSADSVTFKVDYFSLCGDEENYNEDLYNLILNNILVGKDNYDYDKMFTITLDYASWNQISWEQFDILVGLMDIQHNPPVEELPTEDEIEEDIIEEETPVE